MPKLTSNEDTTHSQKGGASLGLMGGKCKRLGATVKMAPNLPPLKNNSMLLL